MENEAFDLGLVTRAPIEPGKLNVNLTVFDYNKNERNETNKRFYVCQDIGITPSLRWEIISQGDKQQTKSYQLTHHKPLSINSFLFRYNSFDSKRF